jgi:hypothetical protein
MLSQFQIIPGEKPAQPDAQVAMLSYPVVDRGTGSIYSKGGLRTQLFLKDAVPCAQQLGFPALGTPPVKS